MAILRIDRLPQLTESLRGKTEPELFDHIQAIHVALREWRRDLEQELENTGGISGITVEDEGSAVGTPSGITTIDFVGGNVVATGSGADATITISGGSGSLTVEDEGTPVGTPGGITTIDFVGGNVVASGAGGDATVTVTTGLTVKDEGGNVGTAGNITSIDFVGSGVTASASGGAATVTVSGGGGGAPTDAKYVVMDYSGSLSEERKLTAGTGISVTDGGANGAVTIDNTFALPVADTQTIVKGSSDATKLIRFEVDGLTTATTRVLTAQDKDLTVAGINVQQQFTTNQRCGVTTLTDGTNISVDASANNNFKVELAGNRTLDNPSNLSDGMHLFFYIKQDANGSRTLAYGSKYKFRNGTTPVLTTASHGKDCLACYYDSTADQLFCVFHKNFA